VFCYQGQRICRNCYRAPEPIEEEPLQDPAEVGGPAEWIEQLPRISDSECDRYETQIWVRPACALEIARQEVLRGEYNVGLLIHGRHKKSPLIPLKHPGQASAILDNSTFKDAVRLAGNISSEGVPVFGGIYACNVWVTKGDFRVGALYSASAQKQKTQEVEQNDLETTMAECIRSLLRIFHGKGHDSLILGAWGCGFNGLDANMVARLFRSALLLEGETRGRFRRVIFAIHDDAEAFSAFHHEFQDYSGSL